MLPYSDVLPSLSVVFILVSNAVDIIGLPSFIQLPTARWWRRVDAFALMGARFFEVLGATPDGPIVYSLPKMLLLLEVRLGEFLRLVEP